VVGTFALLASAWTFQFSLPASLAWDSGATTQAQQALAQLKSEPKGLDGVPQKPCRDITLGEVGPLKAPYRECAALTGRGGYFVTFVLVASNIRGIEYTDLGSGSFADECARHLVGQWWMFSSDEGTGACPFGYEFHGGG